MIWFTLWRDGHHCPRKWKARTILTNWQSFKYEWNAQQYLRIYDQNLNQHLKQNLCYFNKSFPFRAQKNFLELKSTYFNGLNLDAKKLWRVMILFYFLDLQQISPISATMKAIFSGWKRLDKGTGFLITVHLTIICFFFQSTSKDTCSHQEDGTCLVNLMQDLDILCTVGSSHPKMGWLDETI